MLKFWNKYRKGVPKTLLNVLSFVCFWFSMGTILNKNIHCPLIYNWQLSWIVEEDTAFSQIFTKFHMRINILRKHYYLLYSDYTDLIFFSHTFQLYSWLWYYYELCDMLHFFQNRYRIRNPQNIFETYICDNTISSLRGGNF